HIPLPRTAIELAVISDACCRAAARNNAGRRERMNRFVREDDPATIFKVMFVWLSESVAAGRRFIIRIRRRRLRFCLNRAEREQTRDRHEPPNRGTAFYCVLNVGCDHFFLPGLAVRGRGSPVPLLFSALRAAVSSFFFTSRKKLATSSSVLKE